MVEVVAEETGFLVVYKPPGLSFHGDSESGGVLNILRKVFVSERLFAVHRLDKVASGLMLIAKGKEAAQEISAQFRKRAVGKYYLALSDRRPAKKQGAVIGDMKRSRGGEWKLLRSRTNPAVTQFFSVSVHPGLRLFLLKPHSGKTHQLRVALKSLGAPVLGDPLYYTGKDSRWPAERAYLHCFALWFQMGGKDHHFFCPPREGKYFLDDRCRKAILRFTPPWDLSWPKLAEKSI